MTVLLYFLAFFYSPLLVIALALAYNNHPILGLIVGIFAIGAERKNNVQLQDEA